MALNVAVMDGLAAAVIALLVGIAVLAQAVADRQAWLAITALVAGVAGLADLVAFAAGAVEIGAWGWLALIGTLTVLAGSLLERYGVGQLAARWQRPSPRKQEEPPTH